LKYCRANKIEGNEIIEGKRLIIWLQKYIFWVYGSKKIIICLLGMKKGLLLVVFLNGKIYSQDNCDSQATGDWDVAATWINCSGSPPDSTDNVTIKAGHTVTQTAFFQKMVNLTIEATGVLDDNSQRPTVKGNVVINRINNFYRRWWPVDFKWLRCHSGRCWFSYSRSISI